MGPGGNAPVLALMTTLPVSTDAPTRYPASVAPATSATTTSNLIDPPYHVGGYTTLRKYLSIVLTLTLLGIAWAITPITASAACGTAGSIVIAEDSSGGGDKFVICVGSQGAVVNLDLIAHNPSGICNAPVKAQDDWNNCVSSVDVNFASNKCAFFWDGAASGGSTRLMVRYPYQNAGWNNFGSGINDKLTNIQWGNYSESTGCRFAN
jgi:hypothetical protein